MRLAEPKDHIPHSHAGAPTAGHQTCRLPMSACPEKGHMKGTVLVADDDAAIRTVLSQALSRAGYDVRITSNAATLWRWVSAGDGDLVISDVVMPDDNLFDMLPRIRKCKAGTAGLRDERSKHVHDGDPGVRRGAYEYLPKPFDLVE
jgi:two-component system nitrogen regulation response regulator GlnG